MTKFKFILIATIIFLAIFFRCSSREELPADLPVIAFPINHIIDIKLSEFVDVDQNIKLETNTESLIGVIDKVVFFEDKIAVLDRYIAKGIMVFYNNGNFLYKISNKPEFDFGGAYTMQDFIVDEKLRQLEVFDNSNRRILFYDFNGKYIGKIEVPTMTISFEKIKENYVMYRRNMASADTAYNYQLLIYNPETMKLKKHFPYSIQEGMSLTPLRVLYKYEENVRISSWFDNVVKSSNVDGNIIESYFLDYRNKSPLEKIENKTDQEVFKMLIEGKLNNYITSVYLALENKKYMVFILSYKQEDLLCVYNKNLKESKVYKVENNLPGLKSFTLKANGAMFSIHNSLVYVVYSHDLQNIKSYEDIDNNPVLMMINLDTLFNPFQ